MMTLVQHRRRAMMTTRELAAAAGVTQQTLANATKGKAVQFRTMRKIAAALGVPPQDIAEFKAVLDSSNEQPAGTSGTA